MYIYIYIYIHAFISKSSCVISTVARVLNIKIDLTVSIYRTNKTNTSKVWLRPVWLNG